MRLTALFLTAVAALSAPAPGWDSARWGMTAAEVRTAYPAAIPATGPDRDLQIRLRATPVRLSTFQATADFEFPPDSDHLAAVRLIIDTTDAQRAYDTLRLDLTAKYGAPSTSETRTERNAFGSPTRTDHIMWRSPSTAITMTLIYTGTINRLTVRYTERATDPTL